MSAGAISPEGGNRKPLDANSYATKKTIAQGMLDIALLTANASQLKYVLQVGNQHEFYTLMVWLISISIVLQVCVGVIFMVIGGLDINRHKDQRAAIILNDVTLVMVFLISIINVVVSGFGMEHTASRGCQGIIYVMLGSAFNINKSKDHVGANIWNNAVLSMGIVTTIINIIISAFDMRETDKMMNNSTIVTVTAAP